MRLTTMSDYALRLLMYAAQQPDRLCTIAEVEKPVTGKRSTTVRLRVA